MDNFIALVEEMRAIHHLANESYRKEGFTKTTFDLMDKEAELEVKVDALIKSNNICTLQKQKVGYVADDICLACHEGIEEISYIRQLVEGKDKDTPNTVETWRNIAEYLEELLCRILNLLEE